MSECEIRKGLQHAIFWIMWEKAKRWCNENPIEKLEVFKEVNFHIGANEACQTYISFEMNLPEYDGDDWYVGRWSLTWDRNMDAPVMLHFHSLRNNNGYYLKSDCKTFYPIKLDIHRSSYDRRELCDRKVIALMKIIFGFDYNRFKNRFTYND